MLNVGHELLGLEMRLYNLNQKSSVVTQLPGPVGEVSPRLDVASPPADISSNAAGFNNHKSESTKTTASPSESTSKILPSFPKA